MKKFLVGLLSACLILCVSFPVFSNTTVKPVIKQNIQLKPASKVGGKAPELYIQNFRVSSKAVQGKKIPVLSILIKNGGASAAMGNRSGAKGRSAGYTVSIQLSNQQPIEIRTTPDIGPGQIREIKLHNKITVPGGLAPGSHTLKVMVDPRNSVAEIKESNNTATKRVTILSSAMPDLTVSASGSAEVTVGRYIPQFSVVIQNRGNATAPGVPLNQPGNQVRGYFVSFYLTAAGQSNNLATLKTISTTIDLNPGQTRNIGLNNKLRVPANTPPGNYQVRVVIDPARKVAESNETNNVVLHNVRVKSEVPAELGITFNNMTSVLEPGKNIPLLNLVVSNTGEKTAPGGKHNQGFSVALILSTSPSVPQVISSQSNLRNYSDNMSLYFAHYPANLPPQQRQYHALNNKILIPGDTPAGQYYAIAVVDPANRVPESDESNNSAVMPISVRIPPKPDLEITRMMPQGNQVAVTIRNSGTGSIPDSTYDLNSGVGIQYYLNGNPVSGFSLAAFDPNRRLKTPGASVTHSFGTQINCTATPGSHMIEIRVDRINRLEESNENNNSLQTRFDCP